MTRAAVFAGRAADIPEGAAVVVELDARVAVFNVDGEFFAVEDRCSHQEAFLSEGFVDGRTVECPLHASCFDLRTGRPSGPPAVRPVRTYPVVVRDGSVFVTRPAP
ncbi:bifunctional 3-phenylpropionate/cinnamic acid dioxygenase ferredoxin subunit [Amycolatopsis sp. MtRt-6]|uniref:bifunctional 3-phenylpropionate/cinnamic acid dioxygenase ferredoxin subunit n=1 Tax=Amycolatopsis sp. MtRt-6 TaxID=2792782 RepID=UPI001A8E2288|nr:bifunctional 3-phenylpropionate/cinnamic acid dioxygenase ferredoxin subunit [Amycolatopsis sp. MtRt-6]